MNSVAMKDTYPQHPTGYVCILCGGIAVMDADGTYLCEPDAIGFLGAEIEPECGTPATLGAQPARFADLTDVGQVKSKSVAEIRPRSPLIRCASEFHHRNAARRSHR